MLIGVVAMCLKYKDQYTFVQTLKMTKSQILNRKLAIKQLFLEDQQNKAANTHLSLECSMHTDMHFFFFLIKAQVCLVSKAKTFGIWNLKVIL